MSGLAIPGELWPNLSQNETANVAGRKRRNQCLEVAHPVRTIATPAASAAAMTSASFTLPPGCAIAVTPCLTRQLDAVGEREERVGREHAALRELARLLACDLHRDRRATSGRRRRRPCARPRARTMAFDFTCLQTRHANSRAASSSAVGARLVTTLPFVTSPARGRVAILHDEAAADALVLERRVVGRRATRPSRGGGGSSWRAGARGAARRSSARRRTRGTSRRARLAVPRRPRGSAPRCRRTR